MTPMAHRFFSLLFLSIAAARSGFSHPSGLRSSCLVGAENDYDREDAEQVGQLGVETGVKNVTGDSPDDSFKRK